MPSHLFESSKPPPLPVSTPNNDEGSNTEEIRTTPLESPLKPDLGMKRSPPEGEAVLPIPKRQPGTMQTVSMCVTFLTTIYFPANEQLLQLP